MHPPIIKKPLPFVPPEGASFLNPDFEQDYVFCNERVNFKPFNGVAPDTASLFPFARYGIAVFEADNNTAFLAEIFKALTKFV